MSDCVTTPSESEAEYERKRIEKAIALAKKKRKRYIPYLYCSYGSNRYAIVDAETGEGRIAGIETTFDHPVLGMIHVGGIKFFRTKRGAQAMSDAMEFRYRAHLKQRR